MDFHKTEISYDELDKEDNIGKISLRDKRTKTNCIRHVK